jgi:hypothetical protein
MSRTAVGHPEHRAEFVVKPYDRMGISSEVKMTTNPRVYRVAGRYNLSAEKTFPIRDHILSAEDLYAEFEDVEDPKTRYVMPRKCRYTQKYIRACE